MHTRLLRYLFVVTIASLLALSLFHSPWPTPALAAPTFTVDSNSDVVDVNPGDGHCDTGGGVCTLRAAIMEANHTPGGGATIQFNLPNGTVILLTRPPTGPDDETTGDLNITNTMSIIGNGAANTLIDGNDTVVHDRVLDIGHGVVVTISGVTIQNGNCGFCNGSGIRLSAGTLTLSHSVVSGNKSTIVAGGIYNTNGTLIILDSTISGNTGLGGAGGLSSAGRLIMQNSRVTGNHDNGMTVDGTASIVNSTISGNHGSFAGGLLAAGAVTLTNSIVSGNTVDGQGGGIVNVQTVNIINSTVSGNSANTNGGGIGSVGSSMYPAAVNVYNATITNNQADADFNGSGQGGGIYNGAFSTFTFQNTILAANAETAMLSTFWVPVTGECAGTIVSNGFNLMEDYDTSHCTVMGAAPPLVDPHLAPLADNGGSTQTHALLAGSPAIDAGNLGGCRDPFGVLIPTDQRGFKRPVNGGVNGLRCDIGAFEYYRASLFLPLIRK
jgi:CSLREA domain-containing protein